MSKRKRVNKNCKNRVNRSKRRIDAENDDNLEPPSHLYPMSPFYLFLYCVISFKTSTFLLATTMRNIERGDLDNVVG